MADRINNVNKVQYIAGVLGYIASFVCLVLVCVWASHKSYGKDMWLGGLTGYVDGYEQWASWHSVLMVAGFCFALTQGLLAFKLFPFSHIANKSIHILSHISSIFCIGFGIRAIVKYHELHNETHLTSLHSWIGIMVLILFTQNFLLGAVTYLVPDVSLENKNNYFPWHKCLGVTTLLIAATAIATGIHQQTDSDGCESDSLRVNYADLPAGCRIANGLGVLVLITALLVSLALFDFPTYTRADANF